MKKGYLSTIEIEIKKQLRKTKEGLFFFEKGKDYAIKMLTFCVLNQKLLKERTKSKKPLSEIKTLLINFTLVYYYLLNNDSVSNASIQQFEEVLNRKHRKNSYQEPSEIIIEPTVIEKELPEPEVIIDKLPIIELDLDIDALKRNKKPSFLTTRNYEILSEVRDLENLSEERHNQLQDFISKYVNCQQCIDSYKTNAVTDCPKIRELVKKAIDLNLTEFWLESPEYQHCIALVLQQKMNGLKSN